ncbi:DUF192 domain-containing protein [Casimicrobium huifangae]|jgi:hypothetical protein|uniref:DUF192 domain-containing protein n=1 Tax=Casimicrobium huifangae TaxID=2591109 RepID=UPI001EE38C90|nr:DUF192 domain-containing protein [Casimicrobium huifangae]
MKTSVFRAFLATAFAVGSMALLPQQAAAQINKGLPLVELTIGKAKLKAEVAADNNTRTVGLMNRFSLQPDHGMLFVFAQSQPLAFWMKNTYVPLSIAYIDAQGVILNILDMKPHDESTHPSAGAALYALEMKQGWFKDRGIVAGNRVEGLDKAGKARQ